MSYPHAMVAGMGEDNKPINGSSIIAAPNDPNAPRPAPRFTDDDLKTCRPYADKVVTSAEGLTPQVAVSGVALALAMLARVGDVSPFQAWKLLDLWMRILSEHKPMVAPRASLLADRTIVDELEDRLRHLIVCCMHGFDLNTPDVRTVVRGLAESRLEQLQRAKAIATPVVPQ